MKIDQITIRQAFHQSFATQRAVITENRITFRARFPISNKFDGQMAPSQAAVQIFKPVQFNRTNRRIVRSFFSDPYRRIQSHLEQTMVQAISRAMSTTLDICGAKMNYLHGKNYGSTFINRRRKRIMPRARGSRIFRNIRPHRYLRDWSKASISSGDRISTTT